MRIHARAHAIVYAGGGVQLTWARPQVQKSKEFSADDDAANESLIAMGQQFRSVVAAKRLTRRLLLTRRALVPSWR